MWWILFSWPLIFRISVGAQSTLEQDIFAQKYMHEKLTKFPNFTWYMTEKNNKCPNFTWFLPEKYFFPNFGGNSPLHPVSYAYDLSTINTRNARNESQWRTLYSDELMLLMWRLRQLQIPVMRAVLCIIHRDTKSNIHLYCTSFCPSIPEVSLPSLLYRKPCDDVGCDETGASFGNRYN